MSGITELKLGLWNVWILMLFYPLHPITLFFADRLVKNVNIKYKLQMLPYRRSKKALIFEKITIVFLAIYSLFLPIKVDTIWFIIGLPIYLLGLAFFMIAIVISFVKLFEPRGRDNLRTYLILQYDSQPIMFFCIIIFVGISLVASSWLFLLLSIVLGWQVLKVIGEDRLLP